MIQKFVSVEDSSIHKCTELPEICICHTVFRPEPLHLCSPLCQNSNRMQCLALQHMLQEYRNLDLKYIFIVSLKLLLLHVIKILITVGV